LPTPASNRPGSAKGATVSRETSRPIRIAVINQKGGVGKTTTAVSLAHGLALQGRRVLLFDMDPQGNATAALGVEKFTTNPSSYEFLLNDGVPPPPTRTRHTHIDLYPANISLVGAEIQLVKRGENRMNSALSTALDKANTPYDFILFDTPPSLGLITINILAASDYALVPVQAEYLALEGLSMLLETLEQVRQTLNPNLKLLGCVLTMADLRTNLTQEVIRDLRTNLGDDVFNTLIPRTVRLSECPSHGKTIFEYERWGMGARAYEAFTAELLRRLQNGKGAKRTR
jgi:chromosome partitioning protein